MTVTTTSSPMQMRSPIFRVRTNMGWASCKWVGSRHPPPSRRLPQAPGAHGREIREFLVKIFLTDLSPTRKQGLSLLPCLRVGLKFRHSSHVARLTTVEKSDK